MLATFRLCLNDSQGLITFNYVFSLLILYFVLLLISLKTILLNMSIKIKQTVAIRKSMKCVVIKMFINNSERIAAVM